MASACVNNIAVSPDKFPPATYSSYGWLSPRISFSREEDASKQQGSGSSAAASSISKPSSVLCDSVAEDQPEIPDPVDFEFRLDDSVTMLPADELFADGKLMPLRVAAAGIKPVNSFAENRSPDKAKSCRRIEMDITGADPYLFSPKAPRCSSRWKELLGLKKLYQNANAKAEAQKNSASFLSSSSSSSSSSLSSSNPNPKSLKHFLHRSSKSCSCNSSASLDQSLNLPLLKDSDCESVSIASSRLSLSSSSSSHDHEDLPRLSLDSEKPNHLQSPNPNPFILNRNQNQNPPRMRLVKPRSETTTNNSSTNGKNPTAGARIGRSPMRRAAAGGESSNVTSRGVSVDSPRMNSSGKIVFQSLERSSSSPSSFNGGPRYKHRGMERSYSANVRVTPVLNVPVCSLRGTSKSGSVFGFGQLFSSSPQKKDGGSNKGQINQHSSSNRNRSQ